MWYIKADKKISKLTDKNSIYCYSHTKILLRQGVRKIQNYVIMPPQAGGGGNVAIHPSISLSLHAPSAKYVHAFMQGNSYCRTLIGILRLTMWNFSADVFTSWYWPDAGFNVQHMVMSWTLNPASGQYQLVNTSGEKFHQAGINIQHS